jgi:hypothetical protein
MSSELLYLIVIAVGIAFLVFRFFRGRSKASPLGKPCVSCRAPARFGYSKHAEDIEHVQPVCLNCLIVRLTQDYSSFEGKAIVIQPAEGPPAYVYQPLEAWATAFPKSRIADDVAHLLNNLQSCCQVCGVPAKFLWVGSDGLTGDNFSDTLDKGISATLLERNRTRTALCGRCCVNQIERDLVTKGLEYLEVCAPTGESQGFVIPMGY